jgi:hypothetical protein
MTSPDPFEHLDVAYVFGALDAAESAQFETHLATCAQCAARVAEARALTTLLADITPGEVAAPAAVPDTLLPGLLRLASSARRRQHWLVGGLAAVVAACLITLTVLVWPSSPAEPHSRTIAMSAVVASPVHATIELTKTSGGTAIRLHCTYDGTGSSSDHAAEYGLLVVDQNHAGSTLSTWNLEPGQDQWFQASTALSESQISSLSVTYQGQPILTAKI